MTPGELTLLILALLSLQLLAAVPLAIATGLTAVVTALLAFGPNSLIVIANRFYELSTSYTLLAVPLFILMGCILEKGGVTEQLFAAMHRSTGRLRGGLAVGTIGAATVLAGMVGVVGAEIVTLGLVALPAMLRRGYHKRLALGTIAAGGSLGSMIPPSVLLVVYGLIANVSISELFLAAVVPGLLLAGAYALYVLVLCRLRPDYAPLARDLDPADAPKGSLLGVLLPVGIILLVLGSLYAGVATPTEAAALGVLGALLAAAINRRLSLALLNESVQQTIRAVGSVTWIFFGANALVAVYALGGGLGFVRESVTGLALDPWLLILLLMGVFMVLGTFLDWIGIATLTLPIFVPLIVSQGFDPVWFGILFCVNMQVSYLSPPFGPACFYLKSVTPPGISLGDIFRSVVPFIAIQMVVLAIIALFPGLSLWLPALSR